MLFKLRIGTEIRDYGICWI